MSERLFAILLIGLPVLCLLVAALFGNPTVDFWLVTILAALLVVLV